VVRIDREIGHAEIVTKLPITALFPKLFRVLGF